MNYKYPPVYKYAIFIIMTYAFLRHQHIMPLDKILFNSVAILIIIIALDYLIIRNHSALLENTKDEHFAKNIDDDITIMDDDELESIIDSCDINDDIDEPQYIEQEPSRYTYSRKQYGP